MLIRDTCRIFREQLGVYRSVCNSVGLDRHVSAAASWGARERALREAMRQTGVMLPALLSNAELGK